MSQKKYTITAALPYANGPLHLGHMAGAYLPADIYVRYLKLNKKDVVFICGSDEHGAAITLRARKEEKSPQEIVDLYHNINKEAFVDFGIDFSIYDRTSDVDHHKVASAFFKKLYEEGKLEEKTTKQFYDAEAKHFLADRYIIGQCPNCYSEGAYGDQCEKCGKSLSPQELINPESTLSGSKPVLKETTHWFLPMQEHEEWLKEWIKNGEYDNKVHHDASKWKSHVVGQCMSWLDSGLRSRAMTRDLNWGVKVPIESAEGKVLYVWLDAPIGYISATKKWAEKEGKNWEDYWKGEDTSLIHFIGKDNIVFHCIIFPILLKEHGDYILPKNVPANEFLNLEGNKFSTSRNWAVWLHEYIQNHPDKIDEMRYVLASILPENKDSEFTWKDFQAKVNNELVAVLGNFVNRVAVLTQKYYNGNIPKTNFKENIDEELEENVVSETTNLSENIENYKFKAALLNVMNIARFGNKYLADTEPWKAIKSEPERVKTIINIANQIVAKLSIALLPFLPNTSKKLKTQLNIENELDWSMLTNDINIIKEGHQVNKPALLFNKIEDEFVNQELERLNQNNSEKVELKEEISFEDFTKLDIRVGTIIKAEKVKKADKLLQLEVDLGFEKRTIVSGIAKHYSPEEVIGKQVSVLLNLAPRKIRGILSQGMVLMAEDKDENLIFVQPESTFENGSEIR